MTNRRNFFKNLLGLFLAPTVVEALPLPKEIVPPLGYKGDNIFKTGIIYAPYMPLIRTSSLTKNLSLETKEENKFSNTRELY